MCVRGHETGFSGWEGAKGREGQKSNERKGNSAETNSSDSFSLHLVKYKKV